MAVPPAPFADKSYRNIQYVCDTCGRDVGKLNLRAKRVQFLTIGLNGKMIQSRITSWLCISCMETDPDFTRPSRSASPGMRDTKLAKEYDAS